MNAFIVPGVPKLEKRTFKSDNAAVKAAKKNGVDRVLFVELVPQVKSELLVSEFKSKHQLWLEKVQSNRITRDKKKADRAVQKEQKKAEREASKAQKKADRAVQKEQKKAAKLIIADAAKANKKSEAPVIKEEKKTVTPAPVVQKAKPVEKLSFGARMTAIKAAKAEAAKQFNG